jgi:CDP-diglyceride synthetase
VTALWFVVGIPVSIEVLAALLGFVDLVRHRGLRARAVERLVVPTILVGLVLSLAPPNHWDTVAAAFACVVLWQVAAWFAGRRAMRRPGFGAASIDTDDGP